uniref:SID1 transmembrane family member 1 n=1 Tax=Homalodisca liturata TaxID=320908 RepID=A0A1B6JLN8_9HEMI
MKLVKILILIVMIIPTSLSYVPYCATSEKGQKSQLTADFNPIVCNAKFGQQYNGNVTNDTEFIFVFPKDRKITSPARITVVSKDAAPSHPLLVVVTQLKSILSWQIPLVTDTPSGSYTYSQISRTLCPDPDNGEIVVSLSTLSDFNISFVLWVNITQNFDIELSRQYTLKVSPSEPQFYRFQFDNVTSSTLLHVESHDSPCMTLSIQNNLCPVYDLERTIQYQGLWQTVMTKGGIFLRKEEFPNGLFVVFVVHSTNIACTGKRTGGNSDQVKSLTFQLERSIGYWDYVIGVASVLVVFFAIYLAAFLFALCSKKTLPLQPHSVESPIDAVNAPHYAAISSCATTPTTSIFPGGYSDDSDPDETDVDLLYDADSSKEVIRTKQILFLSDLAQKDPRVLSVKSSLFLWIMMTVAVFYALPVVQLVFTYQQVLYETGNQDLCYYNFLCSHRLFFMSDFNHVFSNIGYLLFGLLFIGLTYRRQRISHAVGSHLGIPYHYGMFYALGVALCMEGVLSACYHLCPNHSNFQFDTSFMYVLAVLSMMKIYQTRHPDITASAYTTFGILALVIFLGMFGVLNGSDWFYIVFTVMHLSTCLVVTAQIYHVGTWKFNFGMFSRFMNQCKNDYMAGGLKQSCTPLYPARMILLFLANVGNWGLVAVGYYLHLGDFATYMLSIFLANLMMYYFFYIVMKLVCKEKILKPPAIYILLSFVFWIAGLYFFYYKSISWKLTPAESRAYNQHCEILSFFDKHDIWHFLSSGALFFSFMVLLTLDDDIAEKDRRVIPVF